MLMPKSARTASWKATRRESPCWAATMARRSRATSQTAIAASISRWCEKTDLSATGGPRCAPRFLRGGFGATVAAGAVQDKQINAGPFVRPVQCRNADILGHRHRRAGDTGDRLRRAPDDRHRPETDRRRSRCPTIRPALATSLSYMGAGLGGILMGWMTERVGVRLLSCSAR